MTNDNVNDGMILIGNNDGVMIIMAWWWNDSESEWMIENYWLMNNDIMNDIKLIIVIIMIMILIIAIND